MNRHEAVDLAKETPFPCSECGNILTGYTSIGYTNSEIIRVCKCGKHNTKRWWGCGSEWLDKNDPNDIEILNTDSYRQEFPNLNDSEIIWSQHQIILKQKIEIAELREALFGHHASLPNEINRY